MTRWPPDVIVGEPATDHFTQAARHRYAGGMGYRSDDALLVMGEPKVKPVFAHAVYTKAGTVLGGTGGRVEES